MNSSTKFILQHLAKLKLPLIGYSIIVAASFVSTLLAHNVYHFTHPFSTLLLLSTSILPIFILIFATLHFFSFRSNKAYHIFLTSLPIPAKKQFFLLTITLFLLVASFSFITFLATAFFNTIHPNTHIFTFSLIQIFNMSVIYFATFILFTSILIFLKTLLVHDRAFYIALFFITCSTWFITNIPLGIFSHTALSENMFPLPFNMLNFSPLTSPDLSMQHLLFLFLSSTLFVGFTFQMYKNERKNHLFIKTQKIATMIIYTFILIPTLYTIYLYSNLLVSISILILCIGLAISIIKITFKKIFIGTLLIPFLIANGINIPLIIATPKIIEMQNIDNWNRTQFTNNQSVNLYLSNIPLFQQKRSVQMLLQSSFPQKNLLLKELKKYATIQQNDNTIQKTPTPDDAVSNIWTNNTSFIIRWNSDDAKEKFAKLIENTITEFEKRTDLSISVQLQLSEQHSFQSCSFANDDTLTCDIENKPQREFSSIQKILKLIDTQQATKKNIYTYSILTNIKEPHVSTFIIGITN